MPAAMALRAEESGVKRASTDPLTMLVLSVLAGAFIAFGAIVATTVERGEHHHHDAGRRCGILRRACPMAWRAC